MATSTPLHLPESLGNYRVQKREYREVLKNITLLIKEKEDASLESNCKL